MRINKNHYRYEAEIDVAVKLMELGYYLPEGLEDSLYDKGVDVEELYDLHYEEAE